MTLIVTTAIEKEAKLVKRAQDLAQLYGGVYQDRGKRTMKQIYRQAEGTLVLNKIELIYYDAEGQKLFFHPNTAWLRVLNGRDPLLEALACPAGASVLDATMGMASDSLVMQYFGYQVTALESNPLVHLIVSDGLSRFVMEDSRFTQAMRDLVTFCQDHESYLAQVEDKSIDCVYFDPMFKVGIEESKNLDGIRLLANRQPLTEEALEQAKRVARHRVVVKAHYQDPIFEDLGLTRIKRPNTKFHYGYYQC
ncbi:class I SAM-dependent methyltransferase [Abiotrophia defectiva]|uniref:class I SAM-dependent methyltransferase n=1 Tax=Abiotrophia defectiva TaxID=46125 RepID=UPI002282F7C7|nr:class I SAM-dependent methyltransferase [Abiotrophia defectiva]MCY7224812.1 class I SAM-dependent methyltransferase [Abiotrophia defectiva]